MTKQSMVHIPRDLDELTRQAVAYSKAKRHISFYWRYPLIIQFFIASAISLICALLCAIIDLSLIQAWVLIIIMSSFTAMNCFYIDIVCKRRKLGLTAIAFNVGLIALA